MDDIEEEENCELQPQTLNMPILHTVQLLFMMTNNDWDDEIDDWDDDGLKDDENSHSNAEETFKIFFPGRFSFLLTKFAPSELHNRKLKPKSR